MRLPPAGLRPYPPRVRAPLAGPDLFPDPRLLLPDEPGQGLDAARQPYFRAMLEVIRARGPVALGYVSHCAADIPGSVTRVLELK